MPQQSWTIGSDASCDIVVESPTVSGTHCRLVSDGDNMTLVDLDSTNGTFVNGQRLTGSRSISTMDRITLGQTQPMPWPDALNPDHFAFQDNPQPSTPPATNSQHAQVITLGRGPDNTVVLSESNVSTQHARLIANADGIVLEDLGSTNGTSLGKVENKISRARVEPGDTIFLGSTAYRVSDLMTRAQPTYLKPVSQQAARKPTSKPPAKHPIGLTAIGIGGVLAILLGWLVMRDRDSNDQQVALASSVPPAATASLPAGEVPRQNATDSLAAKTDDVPAVAVELSPQEKLSQSLFVIVCTDPQRKTPFRIGTGFSIDSKHVATSAAVIEAMRGLQENGFPDVILYSPATTDELTIAWAKIHPHYEIANTVARIAQQEHDAIFDNLESEPPKPEAFEAVKEKLLAARVKALQAIDRKTSYDVAVIEVNQTLSHWLPTIGSDTSLRPNQKLRVTGYAFDVEDPYFDRTAPIELSTMSSRIGQLIKSEDDSAMRLSARGGPEQLEYAYFGSPAMNEQGQVVAVYSRPAPSDEEETDSDTESLFDAALFQRVLECLAEQG